MVINKVVASSYYTHPEIGNIRVRVVATAKSIRARWQGADMLVTVPKNYPYDDFNRFIDSNAPRFLELKPAQAFHIGQCIAGNEADFVISVLPDAIIGGRGIKIEHCAPDEGGKARYSIIVAQSIADNGIENPVVQNFINKAVIKAAGMATGRYIIPKARELADIVGRHPLGWDVKHRKRSLGACDSNGIISLSPRLIFLPRHLRDFVIFHELAHLSEMNHSAAFHALCDRYCGGHEAELLAELKQVRFPVY